MMLGIYKIENIKNNKVYIGSSANITTRWNQHLENLYYNTHDNYKLQKDFNKYGLDSFRFSVIEVVDSRKNLFKREQAWIDTIDVESNYNILSYSSYEHVERIKENYDIVDLVISPNDIAHLTKNLIICEHEKMNLIGENKNSLSKSWYVKTSDDNLKTLSNNVNNYYRNVLKIKSGDFYWTSFISYQRKVVGKGCVKSFVSLTTLPKYKRNNLAYLVNNYVNPFLKHKININDDEYAIKVLLNWVMNTSDIENPINIYLPSSRMRKLLEVWILENQ